MKSKEWYANRIKETTGKRYGNLVVLSCWYEKIPSGRQNIMICECICDCGNVCITRHNSLTTGNTTSCGDCILYKHINKKYNHLIILKTWREEHKVFCNCKCDCGNIKEHLDIQNVISGNTKSCGCIPASKPINITGNIYNGNVAIKYIRQSPGGAVWLWKCGNCGRPFECVIGHVTSGHTTSCGCLTESKGVAKIKSLLDMNNIVYITEYTKDDLRNPLTNYKLRFDFYIPSNGHIIEFDGIQHFKAGHWGDEEDLSYRKELDILKNEYCKQHNIPLIRIPYTIVDNLTIEDLLPNSQYILN